MSNVKDFEVQLEAIADCYNEIVSLRERQKDDGIMIRIFLDEIKPLYGRILHSVRTNPDLPENVKNKLIELIEWELERAPGREEKISEYEDTNKNVFSEDYTGDLAENHKLEAPFAIMAEVYNKIRSVRERQKDDGIMGRLYLNELLPIYQSLRAKVTMSKVLTEGIKEELLGLIAEEERLAPIREDEIIAAERAYAEEYSKAYNAALARYAALSPLLKLKYRKQLDRLKDEWDFKSIDEINKFFVPERDIKELEKPEKPESPGDDGEHDGH